MNETSVRAAVAVVLFTVVAWTGDAAAQDPRRSSAPAGSDGKAPAVACADILQNAGMSDQGKKAMRDFMRSDRAPQTMAKMMEMARRMGDGDVGLGMTRVMDMMADMSSHGHGKSGTGKAH